MVKLDPGFTKCECGCNRGQHRNQRGMCNGYGCRCARFVKLTRQTAHMRLMENALHVVIDVFESLPGQGRNIKVGIPDRKEIAQLVAQIKTAIAGPKDFA